MDLSEQHEKIIKEWAASTRYIQAVRLFGSRARGRAPDSDVDLAVTVGGATPEEARGNYYAEKARWQQELTALLRMQADVELQRARRRYRAALLRRVQQVPVRAPGRKQAASGAREVRSEDHQCRHSLVASPRARHGTRYAL
jgi:predicted nucleotidyltransferase